MTETFVKRPGEYLAARAEAAGLEWLRQASDAVVEVVSVSDTSLEIVRVPSVRPTLEVARQAGRELARIHDAGAPAFGSPPPGWEGPYYIGTQEQPCQPEKDWALFYVNQRVLPFVRRARNRGNLSSAQVTVVERACSAILAAGITTTPARLHGDLWAGNLLFGPQGPTFIDPAAHGGHRETDLAMLALFGAPYLDEIRAGYEEIHPLPSGWLSMTPLHQLHPLAVHAVTHGPMYGEELIDAARSTLRLL